MSDNSVENNEPKVSMVPEFMSMIKDLQSDLNQKIDALAKETNEKIEAIQAKVVDLTKTQTTMSSEMINIITSAEVINKLENKALLNFSETKKPAPKQAQPEAIRVKTDKEIFQECFATGRQLNSSAKFDTYFSKIYEKNGVDIRVPDLNASAAQKAEFAGGLYDYIYSQENVNDKCCNILKQLFAQVLVAVKKN